MINHESYESYNWPRELRLTTRLMTDHKKVMSNHESCDQPQVLWPTMRGTIDHESYDWPRELRLTMRAMIDHESYDWPRELRSTMRATIDHESYDWPRDLWLTTRKLWATMRAVTNHKCYDRPRELRLTTRINVLWVVICIVIRAQSKILTLTLLCPSPIHH